MKLDTGEAILYRLEYQRLRAALNIFVPEEDTSSEEQVSA